MIGVFADQTTDAAKAYLAAASSIDDIPFPITASNVEVTAEPKIEGEAVLLLKTVDVGRAVLAKDNRGCRCCLHRWRVAAPCCLFQLGD